MQRGVEERYRKKRMQLNLTKKRNRSVCKIAAESRIFSGKVSLRNKDARDREGKNVQVSTSVLFDPIPTAAASSAEASQKQASARGVLEKKRKEHTRQTN